MYTRHNEVPVYAYRDGEIKALHFNTVQTAFKRIAPEIRIAIPKLKTLDLILQQDAWIVVDRAFNDVPIVAWTEFVSFNRDALHTPVKCKLRYFHAHADIILRRVLEAMEMLLGEKFEEFESQHKVLKFPD